MVIFIICLGSLFNGDIFRCYYWFVQNSYDIVFEYVDVFFIKVLFIVLVKKMIFGFFILGFFVSEQMSI